MYTTLLFSSALLASVSAYTQTIEDCNTFAATFATTNGVDGCVMGSGSTGGTPMSGTWSTVHTTGTQITCAGADSWCVGDATSDAKSSSCTHEFKQCVTCSTNGSGEVEIRYQSVNMPNYCWETSAVAAVADYQAIDFQVTWNKDMSSATHYSASDFNSHTKMTTELCAAQRLASTNLPTGITYTAGSGAAAITTAAGGTVGGVILYNGLDAAEFDAVISEVDTMDLCLENAGSDSFLRHQSLSPCSAPSSSVASTSTKPGVGPPNTGTACLDNGYMYKDWPTANYGGSWGLAQDGHVIYGPYNADGELWSCEDVDVCNGFTLADSSYGYASTTFFPYSVGCYGPGPAQNFAVDSSCSTNACGLLGASHLVLGLSATAALLATSLY